MNAALNSRASEPAASIALLHFGKLRARGDFVRSAGPLVDRLDQWFSATLEQLANDPNWKLRFDQAAPLHFAVLGSRQQRVVAGHLRPSVDSAGRRFPFVVAGSLDLAEGPLLDRAGMLLNRLWHRSAQAVERAQQLGETALAELAQLRHLQHGGARDYQAVLNDHFEVADLWHLQAQTLAAHPDLDLARSVLALGLLMRPVHASGAQRVDKGVVLPLPAEPLAQLFAINWWLALVAPFLQLADFEVLLLVPQGTPAPLLKIGLSGASAVSLVEHFGALAESSAFVDLRQAEWVDEQLDREPALLRLASLLRQGPTSLRSAINGFHETFLRD